MLKRLQIQNLAILENIDVTFKEGFTCLLGETGAGKSLIIDSLSLLLGSRAYAEWIRAGEDKALVRGEFEISSPLLKASLAKKGILLEDDQLIVERLLTKSKNVVKINGTPLPLNELAKISPYLADIHSQFDYGKILHPENYFEIMDSLSPAKAERYLQDYLLARSAYFEQKKEYEALLLQQKKIEEDRDFLEFQYKELKEAGLEKGEEEKLANELALLRNYDKIYALTQEADSILHSDFLDKLYDLGKDLSKLSEYQKEYEETRNLLDDRYYELEDVFSTLKKKFKNLDYDPSRLEELQSRESELASLKRKYKKNIEDLIAHRDHLALLLGEKGNLQEEIKEAKEKKDHCFEEAYLRGQELSSFRQGLAKTIEKEIRHHLKDLNLESAFEVCFFPFEKSDDALTEDGIDRVDFYIEPNPGEGMKSLSRIASGGEASRIMLAFKALFLKCSGVSTIVFDEIDSGISGEAASKVAKKIQEISLSTQVIAITHTPQVASAGDHHLLISKTTKEGRTFASIKELNLNEKVEALATMIHGKNPSEKQLEAAKEMLFRS